MCENPRRDGQATNFTTNVSKILDLKSSSEQIFFRKLSLGAPASGRVECAGLNLTHCCGSIGLRLTRNENLSELVCRACARKSRNATQLSSFIEKAVSNTIVDEDLD